MIYLYIKFNEPAQIKDKRKIVNFYRHHILSGKLFHTPLLYLFNLVYIYRKQIGKKRRKQLEKVIDKQKLKKEKKKMKSIR